MHMCIYMFVHINVLRALSCILQRFKPSKFLLITKIHCSLVSCRSILLFPVLSFPPCYTSQPLVIIGLH